MTGLDPDAERILEIAVLVTDAELNVLAEGPHLVLRQPEEILGAMDDWNKTHHGKSGLLERVRASAVDESGAQSEVMAFLKEHTTKGKAPLAGNSIHQDRRFLVRYLPEIETWLNYRNIDVSTIKELASRWFPKQYAKRPTKKATHRAMDDIKESIAELRFYREAVFRPAP